MDIERSFFTPIFDHFKTTGKVRNHVFSSEECKESLFFIQPPTRGPYYCSVFTCFLLHFLFFFLFLFAAMATNETISSTKCGKKYRAGNICVAVNCHNKTSNSSVSVFKFLTQKERYS